MLKLAQALGAWSPGEGVGPSDPVVLLGAAWSDIVGDENARNSHPAQLAGDTLMIVTASSVWSAQLSYLAEQIVVALQARVPRAGITKVRFRVGKLPARGGSRSRVARVIESERLQLSSEPAGDASEALQRFRATVDTAERAKRALGWKECSGCTALIAPTSGLLCTTCEIARGAERERRISRLLFEAPWLGFAGTAKLIEDLRQDEYESIRRRLLSRWWDRLRRVRLAGTLSRDGAERLIASSYVLLKSELAPERLTPAIVRNVLGDDLHDLLYETVER
jgi:Dna[CI] antecedent, DciA